MKHTDTKQINVGGVLIGGGAPIPVQSMCNTRTSDAKATIDQIKRLYAAGYEIIRLAVPDSEAAEALPEIVKASPIPVVADIHFDYRLALAAAEAGVQKIRINPGNIGEAENVRKVAEACKARQIPIRIGVNGGSLEKRLLEKYGHPTAEALVERVTLFLRTARYPLCQRAALDVIGEMLGDGIGVEVELAGSGLERMALGVVVELAQSRRQILPFGVELWDVILLLAQIIERDFVGQQRHVVGVFDPFVDG